MKVKPAVLGGFILGAVALGVGAILLFGGQRLFSTSTRLVTFFDESVAGLRLGSPVTFHGVPIGQVEKVGLMLSSTAPAARIPVVLEVRLREINWEGRALEEDEDSVVKLLDAGLRAQLAPQSLVTGQMRIDLDLLPATPAELSGSGGDLPEVPTIASDLGRLRDKVAELPMQELANRSLKVLENLETITEQLEASLPALITDIETSVQTASLTVETTGTEIQRIRTDASAALAEFKALASDLRGQVNARGAEVERTMGAAERAARAAEALMTSLNDLAGPRGRVRADIEAATRDLSASAGSFRNFARQLERDPSSLLREGNSR